MEKKIVFAETSWLIALAIETDKFHKEAVVRQKEYPDNRLLVTNVVIWETLGWVRNKFGQRRAVELLEALADLPLEKIKSVDEVQAVKYFRRLTGRGVSMIDCLSMAVMKRLKIKKILTFDSDFEKAGFEIISG